MTRISSARDEVPNRTPDWHSIGLNNCRHAWLEKPVLELRNRGATSHRGQRICGKTPMRRLGMQFGVPASAIELDLHGVNIQAMVRYVVAQDMGKRSATNSVCQPLLSPAAHQALFSRSRLGRVHRQRASCTLWLTTCFAKLQLCGGFI